MLGVAVNAIQTIFVGPSGSATGSGLTRGETSKTKGVTIGLVVTGDGSTSDVQRTTETVRDRASRSAENVRSPEITIMAGQAELVDMIAQQIVIRAIRAECHIAVTSCAVV